MVGKFVPSDLSSMTADLARFVFTSLSCSSPIVS